MIHDPALTRRLCFVCGSIRIRNRNHKPSALNTDSKHELESRKINPWRSWHDKTRHSCTIALITKCKQTGWKDKPELPSVLFFLTCYMVVHTVHVYISIYYVYHVRKPLALTCSCLIENREGSLLRSYMCMCGAGYSVSCSSLGSVVMEWDKGLHSGYIPPCYSYQVNS